MENSHFEIADGYIPQTREIVCQEKRKAQGVKWIISKLQEVTLPVLQTPFTNKVIILQKRMVIFCIQKETKKAVFFFKEHVYPEQNILNNTKTFVSATWLGNHYRIKRVPKHKQRENILI